MQEAGGRRAVHNPVIIGERKFHHRPYTHLIIYHNRLLRQLTYSKDTRFRRVDNGGEAIHVKHTQVGDSEGATGEFIKREVALFDTLVKKLNFGVHTFSVPELFKKYSHDVSGAEIESMLIRAMQRAVMEGRTMISKEDMEEVMDDFIPPQYPHAIRLQNLVAAVECTSKKMVPKRFQLDNSQMVREIQELKILLGERK